MMNFSICCCTYDFERQHLSASAPLLHYLKSHISQDSVLYLDLCCRQHAETCYLHIVHLWVLVEVLRLSGFGLHCSKWLNCRVKCDGFWVESPLFTVFFLLSKSISPHNTPYSCIIFESNPFTSLPPRFGYQGPLGKLGAFISQPGFSLLTVLNLSHSL